MAIVAAHKVTNSTVNGNSFSTTSITPTADNLVLAWVANTQTTTSAITAANLTTGENTDTGQTSATTASISPGTNKLILLSVAQRKTDIPPNVPTSVTGCGLTWVQVSTRAGGGAAVTRITLFRALGTASPGAVTINYDAAQRHSCWTIEQFDNMDTSGTNGSGAIVQSATNNFNSGTSITVTLGAFSSTSNATFGCIAANNGTTAFTLGSGFSLLGEKGSDGGQPTRVQSEWRNDNDTTVNWSFPIATGAALAIEIKNANQTGGTPQTPTLTGNSITWAQVASVLDTTSIARRLTLFRALNSAPTVGAVTIDFAGVTQTGCAWSISEFSGIDTSGTNGSAAVVQSTTNAAATVTSLTATLAAFASTDNGCAGGFSTSINTGITQGSGFTELGETTYITPTTSLQSEWKATNDTTVDASFASGNAEGIAVEIKAAPSGTIVGAHLNTSGDGADLFSYNTAPVTPGANQLVLLAITNTKASDPDAVASVTGNSLTWVQVLTSVAVGGTFRVSVFRAMGASPSSGAIAISFGGATQTGCAWSISQYSGVDTSGTNGSGAIVQSTANNDTGTSFTVTLGTFSNPSNATYGAAVRNVNTGITPGGGFTEFGEIGNGVAPAFTFQSQWRPDNDTTVDWTATNSTWRGVAIEIKSSAQTLPVISYFSPVYSITGAVSVVITGSGFTGATSVKIGTTDCSFTVDSNTQITITNIPVNASTGVISITTASGTGTSTNSFIVTLETINLTKTFGGSINMSWSFNLADETLGDGFRIKQGPARTGPFTTQQTLATTARSAIQPVTNAVNTQYYEVVFFNIAVNQESPVTSIIRANVTAPPEPGAPTLTSVTAPTQTSITWFHTDTSDETGYDYETSPNGTSSWTVRGSNPAGATAFTWTGAVASTTYFMRVGAFGISGVRHYSNVLSVTTPAVVPPEPTAPTLNTFTASDHHTINFSYTNVSNELGYEFFTSTDNVTFTLVGSNAANTTAFAWTGALASTFYYGYVASFGPAGTRYPSGTLTVTTPAAPAPPEPTAPTLNTLTSPTNVSLTWTHTDVSNETAYTYETSLDNLDPWTQRGTNPPNSTTFTWTGAANSTLYYGRVSAVGTSTIAISNVLSVTTDPPPPDPTPPEPTAPTLITVTAPTSTSITWNHSNIANELGYIYETSDDNVTFTTRGTTPPDSTTFTWSAALQGTIYYMRVSSIGNVTTYPSNVMTVQTPATEPTPPTLTSCIALSATSIQWIHTDVDNELGYEYLTSDGATTTIRGTNPPGSTTFIWTTASASTSYFCTVGAIGPTTIATSNIISVTTPPAPFVDPIAPTLLAVTSTSNSLTWFYTNVTDEVGYEFEVSTDNVTFVLVGSATANANEFTWTSANSSTFYYLRVKSYGLSGVRYASNVLSISTSAQSTPGSGGNIVSFNPIISLGTFTVTTPGIPIRISDFIPQSVVGSVLTISTSSSNGSNAIIYLGDRTMTTGVAKAAITLKGPNKRFQLINQKMSNSLAPSTLTIDSDTAGSAVYLSIQIA